MSLNWNVQNTAAYEALIASDEESYTDEQHTVLDALIWSSLVVDLPGFKTDEEADEFFRRMVMADRLGMSAYSPIPSREDMQEWVGMTTNVSRKTRHQWVKRIGNLFLDEYPVPSRETS